MISGLAFGFLCLSGLAAAAWDLASYRIPNWLCFITAAGFFFFLILINPDIPVIGSHVLVGFLALLAGYVLFAMRLFGAGDGKYLAATALWFGPGAIAQFSLNVALLGGLLGILFIAFRALPMRPAMAGAPWLERLHNRQSGLPYGVAIGLGAILTSLS